MTHQAIVIATIQAPANVNPMLVLRNAVCNERWEEVWKEIEEAQRQEARARRMLRQRGRREHVRLRKTTRDSGRGNRIAVGVTHQSGCRVAR